MERGKEGKGGNNEWGGGGEGEGERGGERKKWLQKWSIGEKHKKVDGRLLSLVKTRCGIYPVTYFWTCPSLRSSWPFPFHWSLINSLYSLLFTMHEIGPSVRAWSTIWTRCAIPILSHSRLQWQYYRKMKWSPFFKLVSVPAASARTFFFP